MKDTDRKKDNSSSYWPAASSYRSERGVTVMLVLAFVGIFGLVLGTIASYSLMQSKYWRALYAREQALHIAEAGLEYYRWFLAHNPSILVDGAGLVSPYDYTVDDPEGGELGETEVTATASLQCNSVQWIDIASRGKSNAGIRIDATHNSDVTSAVATWNCTSGYNCNPPQSNAPGVVGDGSNPALWTYPVPNINFAVIGVNFTDLRDKAQNQGGIYYAPASGSVNNRGYHFLFNADGTVTIRRVTSTVGHSSYSSQYNWGTEYSTIKNETLLGTYTIPSSCSLIFVEDRVWVEGTVSGKVTIVAATPDNSSTSPDAYLRDDVLYASNDGSDGLTIIAERNVLIPLVVPTVMEIHGVFVAQSGHYGRDYFSTSYLPSQYDQYVTRDQLTTVGTVVSNGRTGTAWSNGTGFQQRYDYYDQLLAFSPPPFTPTASTDYGFVLWREE